MSFKYLSMNSRQGYIAIKISKNSLKDIFIANFAITMISIVIGNLATYTVLFFSCC